MITFFQIKYGVEYVNNCLYTRKYIDKSLVGRLNFEQPNSYFMEKYLEMIGYYHGFEYVSKTKHKLKEQLKEKDSEGSDSPFFGLSVPCTP